MGFFRVRADVLLHLIEHHQCERELAVLNQRVIDGVDHLLVGHILHIGVLLSQQLAYLFDVIAQSAVDGQQSAGNAAGDIKVFQLVVPVVACCFNVGFNLIENTLLAQPQHKARLVVLLRQPGGFEHYVQQGQAHIVVGAGT
ncbi:hypothetical protein D9M69_433160 [compost metagenome]